MTRTALLGLPRVGPDRELKFALEEHWAGRLGADELNETARALRAAAWQRAQAAGIDVIPSGDFSLYDHVLDTAWALGAIPRRFGDVHRDGLADYFVMARGDADRRPLEMTKWFDTNYHYLVPELEPDQAFALRTEHWTGPLAEATALEIATRPVVLGPLSFLLLSKGTDRPLDLLPRLVALYVELLRELAAAGASEVQLDEPCLAVDRTTAELELYATAFAELKSAGLPIALATYFAGIDVGETLERVVGLGPAELHLDLVRAPSQLAPALDALRSTTTRLSLGLLDGRNVWVADLDAALDRIDAARSALGSDRLTIAPSCSLLHLPYEAARETGIDDEVRGWLAFAAERIAELRTLGDAVTAEPVALDLLLDASRGQLSARRKSARTNDPAVRARIAALQPEDYARDTPAERRRALQHERVPLPELPTTTIGSYPQTPEIRHARRRFRDGTLPHDEYVQIMEARIAEVVAFEEGLGMDVLVHGEPERNDMVEYFGEQLAGFAFSAHGWVQSYGSRCVKPPILYGDVARPRPMTVDWWRYAQSLTERPVKGMLTGPVTILQWSFVRDDQP
ncbi:MAG: 5-methyltetrahydropteroyltriglutamate--homocysteine methyltransferase, partial [Solirubrobacteraceae bacterium]|nr:5-methyltetrahydropteroyltriglutamate--homocysteine methyltransferase [Solirubrobacteraceae bacterium]